MALAGPPEAVVSAGYERSKRLTNSPTAKEGGGLSTTDSQVSKVP